MRQLIVFLLISACGTADNSDTESIPSTASTSTTKCSNPSNAGTWPNSFTNDFFNSCYTAAYKSVSDEGIAGKYCYCMTKCMINFTTYKDAQKMNAISFMDLIVANFRDSCASSARE